MLHLRKLSKRSGLAAMRAFVRVTPGPIQAWTARRLAGILRRGAGRPMRLARENLELAFPNKSPNEREQILKGFTEHLVYNFFEFCRLPYLGKQRIINCVAVEGEENLHRALGAGKGVIALSAHFGNWEFLGARLAAAGFRLVVIGREQEDEQLDNWIMRTRSKVGMEPVFSRQGMMRAAVNALKENAVLGLLSDMYAGNVGVKVPFFGMETSSFKGAAVFARSTGAAVLPMFCFREGYMKHRLVVEHPIEVQWSEDKAGDIRQCVAEANLRIEAAIQKSPALWLWPMKRWKEAHEYR